MMGTIIGDYIGTTIGIHSPFPTKHQGLNARTHTNYNAYKFTSSKNLLGLRSTTKHHNLSGSEIGEA